MKLMKLLKGFLPLLLLFGGCPLIAVSYETTGEFYVECPVGETMSVYSITSDKFPQDFTCNTQEMQNATATFTDGTTVSLFIENNGQFVSWSVPPEYICTADFGNGTESIQTTGNRQLNEPQNIRITCGYDETIIIMDGNLVPTMPEQQA